MLKIDKNYLNEFKNISLTDYFGGWIGNDNLNNLYKNAKPFKHIIIDNFLNTEYIEKIFNEFPTDFSSNLWHKYNNPLEVKYSNDNIDNMDVNIKNLFYILSTSKFIDLISTIVDINDLEYDPYLHGAGLHVHPRFGRLNLHLDYEKHPLLNMERRLNIILYLSKDWKDEWNGMTELWDENVQNKVVESKVKFNRAIIFQTNDISWHGIPEKILCPDNEYRKSFAFYYISPPTFIENKKQFGVDANGYRMKASYIKRPSDPDLKEMNEIYKIRPFRRITDDDMKTIWKEWTPELF